MKLTSSLIYHPLKFNFEAGTSRGILTEKLSWFLILNDDEGNRGIGEVSIIPNLSPEWDPTSFPKFIEHFSKNINDFIESPQFLNHYPAVKFALECASSNLKQNKKGCVFPGPFYEGKREIPINGLVWMGNEDFMKQQIKDKIDAGFKCIKMKIGAIDFDTELSLLKSIRNSYSKEEITLRVDANGAFGIKDAPAKLDKLSKLDIHSIEQPIKAGQVEKMAALCKSTPLPIALDEELIGIYDDKDKSKLLDAIQPQYIILKPSLMDGISGTKKWIEKAEERKIDWWMTSALESNIGLNAIAQLCDSYAPKIPQGLGTGNLYKNNIDSPLEVRNGCIKYNKNLSWSSPVEN